MKKKHRANEVVERNLPKSLGGMSGPNSGSDCISGQFNFHMGVSRLMSHVSPSRQIVQGESSQITVSTQDPCALEYAAEHLKAASLPLLLEKIALYKPYY